MEMVTSSSISVNPGLQKLEDDLGALENCEPAPSPSGGKLKFRRHWPVPFSRNPTVHILGAVSGGVLAKQDAGCTSCRGGTSRTTRNARAPINCGQSLVIALLRRPTQ